MTNAQWSNVITKLTTALNAAANDTGDLGTYTNALFAPDDNTDINIYLEQTQEYNNYKIVTSPNNIIYLNIDYVIGATQTDLSSKVATAISAACGDGAIQQ